MLEHFGHGHLYFALILSDLKHCLSKFLSCRSPPDRTEFRLHQQKNSYSKPADKRASYRAFLQRLSRDLGSEIISWGLAGKLLTEQYNGVDRAILFNIRVQIWILFPPRDSLLNVSFLRLKPFCCPNNFNTSREVQTGTNFQYSGRSCEIAFSWQQYHLKRRPRVSRDCPG